MGGSAGATGGSGNASGRGGGGAVAGSGGAVAPGTVPYIQDLWGRGPSDVWASGFDGLVLHFDGTTWRRRDRVVPGNLFALSGGDVGELWALEGRFDVAPAVYNVVRGDGTTFEAVDVGAEPDEIPRRLFAVGPGDLWLTGRFGEDRLESFGMARHFDGSTWSLVGSGLGDNLVSAWGTANDMFFVGTTDGGFFGIASHWIDGTWAESDYPDPILIDVWGSSATDVWAIGTGTEALHYDGSSWVEVSVGTDDASTILQRIWGSSATDVWAVGYRGYAGTPAQGVIVHFDGVAWSLRSDSPAEPLYAIWGSGPDDVWAGGGGAIVHYQAGAWTRLSASDIH